ncbi:TetR/AcrR family transcriptional regulator [Geodermatophilus pulveris]|nr:TetR/AcrR family transcriptional regulator [Geodermatophilus pulveris]
MSKPTRTAYRHGDLPAALLAAGTELARRGGPEAVVLREATRRVGVSPNAAYRHFADHRALLRAVCAVAMSQLARSMEAEQAAVAPADPQRTALLRLRAVGAGYLRYAREQPGLFRTAFAAADELTDEHDACGDSGLTPLELLNAALDELVRVGLVTAERRRDAEMVAWSAVHGLSMLLLEGPLRGLDDAHADRVGRQLLDHVEAGLLASVPAGGPG